MDAARIEEIATKRGIELLIQFGSTVTGQVHSQSDLDLAILFVRDTDLWEQGDLIAELQELSPRRQVDIVILNRADPLLLRKISEAGRLVHGSPRRFAEWKMFAYRRYQDHRRYLDLERQYVRRTLSGQA